MPRQETLQASLPGHEHLSLGHHLFHPIRQFLLPGIGGLVRPRLGLTQLRQLGNHRGIFAVVLRGHAVEDLRIIMDALVPTRRTSIPLSPTPVVRPLHRPPRLQSHHQLPVRLDLLQDTHQRRDLPGILDPPGTLEPPIGPATKSPTDQTSRRRYPRSRPDPPFRGRVAPSSPR